MFMELCEDNNKLAIFITQLTSFIFYLKINIREYAR